MNIAVLGFAVILASWAGWLDWRSRRIPNWLTVPALVLGLTLNTAASRFLGGTGTWAGMKFGLAGAGLGLLLLLPFVLLRGLGAGDWKLMGALGAFLGGRNLLYVLFGTVLIAGLMAVVEMIRRRRVRQTLANLAVLIHAFVTFRLRPQRGTISLDNPDLMTVPFGVAAAVATTIFVFAFFVQVAFKIS
jgi:prepilin peptidase CpaA